MATGEEHNGVKGKLVYSPREGPAESADYVLGEEEEDDETIEAVEEVETVTVQLADMRLPPGWVAASSQWVPSVLRLQHPTGLALLLDNVERLGGSWHERGVSTTTQYL